MPITAIKVFIVILDLLLAGITIWFAMPLRWENDTERPTIFGLSVMAAAYIVSATLVAFG